MLQKKSFRYERRKGISLQKFIKLRGNTATKSPATHNGKPGRNRFFFCVSSEDFAADQIVVTAVCDLHVDKVTGIEVSVGGHINHAVNIGGVRRCAAHGNAVLIFALVNQNTLHGADLFAEVFRGNLRLHLHEALAALFAHFLGQLSG